MIHSFYLIRLNVEEWMDKRMDNSGPLCLRSAPFSQGVSINAVCIAHAAGRTTDHTFV